MLALTGGSSEYGIYHRAVHSWSDIHRHAGTAFDSEIFRRLSWVDLDTGQATLKIKETDTDLNAARVSIGALGIIITQVTIQCVLLYDLENTRLLSARLTSSLSR
jgi:hypothetical protein